MKVKDVFEKESVVARWDSEYYHPIALWLYDRAISDMLRLMNVDVGSTILDAGCGPGVHSIRVAKAGFHVCAVDISKTMLKHASQRAKSENVEDSIDFYQKDITQLDSADGSFQYVFSWGVIIHIPEVEKALNELTRIIKPGGKLALYVVNKKAIDHMILRFVRFILRKPYRAQEYLPLGHRTWHEIDGERLCVWAFDRKAIIDYLERKGFHLLAYRTGELSEMQCRFKGYLRFMLLHINNISYRLNLFPRYAMGNLFIFEKEGGE